MIVREYTAARRMALMAGVAGGLLAYTPAYAQAVQSSAAATPTQETQAAPISADAGSPDDIVVTARKREETLQDVPMSVSAITGAELDRKGISDVTDLYAHVPGLFQSVGGGFNNTSDFTYLTIRGVGFNAGLEPAVGVFIDGMYQPQIGFDTSFLDLDRVEVLRGPQGTLFGRNTQGGAVNMVTHKPGPDFRGKLRLEGAEFGTLKAQGSFSGPIADKLYAGIAAEYSRSDGYVKNSVLGGYQNPYEQYALRGTLRWAPTDALDVSLIADTSHKTYNELSRGVPLPEKKYVTDADQDRDDYKDNHGAQLNIDYKLGGGITLTSISGYRESKSDIFVDSDGRITDQTIEILPAYPPLQPTDLAAHGATSDIGVKQRFVSQELRLSGSSSQFDWLGGLYYFDQRQDQTRLRQIGPGVAAPYIPFALYIAEKYRDNRHGFAGFGQASYRPVEKVELTLGARYSNETVDAYGNRVTVYGAPLNAAQPAVKDGHLNSDNVSLMASAKYKFSRDVQVYATYADGWKAGGINRFPSNLASSLPYKDETSKNYEIGVKTEFLDHRATFNAAVYQIDIRNQQLSNIIPGDPLPVNVIDNAASSRVRGLEFEADLRPTDRFQLSGSFAYTDTRFNKFVRVFTIGTDEFDFAGHHFENVPEITANASALYTVPLSESTKLQFQLDYSYIDKVVLQDNVNGGNAAREITVPAYGRVDATVSLLGDSGWSLAVYAKNLFNKFDYNFASSDQFDYVDYPVYVTPLPPRQFGVVISKSF